MWGRAISETAPPSAEPEDGDPEDVANDEAEEDFEAGMRHAAADYQAHDTDGDHKLDFNEFCVLVRDRESGEHTDEELRARFEQLDADGRCGQSCVSAVSNGSRERAASM